MYYGIDTFCVIVTLRTENNFLLESLATCEEHEKPDLEMYFMVN